VDGRAEPIDRVEIPEVGGNQRRRAAEPADRVVEFFERALRARQCDDMRARLASSSATARPMPRDAPVTTAIRPCKL
jgi:hypothetical protein